MSAEENKQDAATWLALAGLDLQAGEKALRGDDPLPRDACFHAQQAAEKSLKAYLVSRGVHPRRTHHLGALLGECADLDEGFRVLAAACEFLNPFAIETRYPSRITHYTLEQARRALDLAKQIAEFATAKMP
jgi:HEPN domain-containing protein